MCVLTCAAAACRQSCLSAPKTLHFDWCAKSPVCSLPPTVMPHSYLAPPALQPWWCGRCACSTPRGVLFGTGSESWSTWRPARSPPSLSSPPPPRRYHKKEIPDLLASNKVHVCVQFARKSLGGAEPCCLGNQIGSLAQESPSSFSVVVACSLSSRQCSARCGRRHHAPQLTKPSPTPRLFTTGAGAAAGC